ncbi:hypothetical protein AMECASPLE_038550 [Ameca splendens]|uniref:Uncharacterized protein n=1 Tax=Ameca splendens TaxID=208324 RepID=A0ABV1A4Y9_9TELE
MCVCLYVIPLSFLTAPESDFCGIQSPISPKTQTLPWPVGGHLLFLVHFNFFRTEGKLCSSLFLLCLHKMCSQDESSVMLFWLWQTAWIFAHLNGFCAFYQTSSEKQ